MPVRAPAPEAGAPGGYVRRGLTTQGERPVFRIIMLVVAVAVVVAGFLYVRSR